MSYKINITDNAAADLYQIYDYIEKVLFAPKAAENLYNDIMDMIKSLGEMPERYREYDAERFSGKNLRFVNVKNYDIQMTWDAEAAVWVASSDDVPGLALESGSFDALVERVKYTVPLNFAQP